MLGVCRIGGNQEVVVPRERKENWGDGGTKQWCREHERKKKERKREDGEEEEEKEKGKKGKEAKKKKERENLKREVTGGAVSCVGEDDWRWGSE